MENEDWLNLLERLDSIHIEEYTLSRKDIEAIWAIDIELMEKDEKIEELTL